jgi:hypothetical protein
MKGGKRVDENGKVLSGRKRHEGELAHLKKVQVFFRVKKEIVDKLGGRTAAKKIGENYFESL